VGSGFTIPLPASNRLQRRSFVRMPCRMRLLPSLLTLPGTSPETRGAPASLKTRTIVAFGRSAINSPPRFLISHALLTFPSLKNQRFWLSRRQEMGVSAEGFSSLCRAPFSTPSVRRRPSRSCAQVPGTWRSSPLLRTRPRPSRPEASAQRNA